MVWPWTTSNALAHTSAVKAKVADFFLSTIMRVPCWPCSLVQNTIFNWFLNFMLLLKAIKTAKVLWIPNVSWLSFIPLRGVRKPLPRNRRVPWKPCLRSPCIYRSLKGRRVWILISYFSTDRFAWWSVCGHRKSPISGPKVQKVKAIHLFSFLHK